MEYGLKFICELKGITSLYSYLRRSHTLLKSQATSCPDGISLTGQTPDPTTVTRHLINVRPLVTSSIGRATIALYCQTLHPLTGVYPMFTETPTIGHTFLKSQVTSCTDGISLRDWPDTWSDYGFPTSTNNRTAAGDIIHMSRHYRTLLPDTLSIIS